MKFLGKKISRNLSKRLIQGAKIFSGYFIL